MPLSHRERRLKSTIEEEVKKQEGWLAEGAAKDYADYKYAVGIVRGLEMVVQILEQLEKED